ncbi:apolipoprotein A-I-like [Rana temporaria]|uniref:apolipoprotein A-I-like n=1 Tax=Rana temporaria TaxID=8407 RepID=UPI001AAD13E3|nr:apolipoprotein A-I-like [Rana temporaria]
MKVLLLGLALLFTGAHGKHFWQQDKPHESNLWSIIENGIAIAADTLKNLEHSEIAEKFKLSEKLEAAKNNAEQSKKVLDDYFHEVWKDYDEKLHKNFPVLMKNVYPLMKKFDDNVEEVVIKSVKQLVPVTSEFVSGLKEEMNKFWVGVGDMAGKARDEIRAEFDTLRTKVHPYAEEVKGEYEKYKENMKTNWEGKAKHMKDEVEKDLEELGEKLKPYFEEIKKQVVPHAEDMQKHVEILMKAIHEYFDEY